MMATAANVAVVVAVAAGVCSAAAVGLHVVDVVD